ncbi:MAG TPA: pyridoxamine 5'-phosphate oxidase family protein [Candidatus Binatia bacterium]|nr:pyridoxamine 5'-phosphate oxidase family protein [Candidatus Binatia bacterium]
MQILQSPTARTRLHRRSERGRYDRATLYAILDEGLVCHVGFVSDHQPYVIPTTYARRGDDLYIHGSAASRMLRTLADEIPVCATVTLLDGLVLARSAFHHSMNYRSAMVLGAATAVLDPNERLAALEAIVDHVLKARWSQVRPPSPQELKATAVLRLPLNEASAKIRSGPPLDDEDDLAVPCWAGEIPLRLVAGSPVADPHLAAGIEAGAAIINYRRPKSTD